MKKYLSILLLLFLIPIHSSAVMVVGSGGVSCTSFTADIWQNLDASDFLTSPPSGWTVTDASSKLSMSTSGEHGFTNFNCPNGNSDSGGVRGLAYDHTGNAVAYITYTAGSSKSSSSFGFWYKSGTLAGTYSDFFIFQTAGAYINVYGVGAADVRLTLRGATNSSAITISQATWYWVTGQIVQNTTSSLAVYDVNGTQVGTTVTCTASNSSWTMFQVGNVYYGAGSGTSYFDDPVFDWTDSTFPLGK